MSEHAWMDHEQEECMSWQQQNKQPDYESTDDVSHSASAPFEGDIPKNTDWRMIVQHPLNDDVDMDEEANNDNATNEGKKRRTTKNRLVFGKPLFGQWGSVPNSVMTGAEVLLYEEVLLAITLTEARSKDPTRYEEQRHEFVNLENVEKLKRQFIDVWDSYFVALLLKTCQERFKQARDEYSREQIKNVHTFVKGLNHMDLFQRKHLPRVAKFDLDRFHRYKNEWYANDGEMTPFA